jgi:hypothetical protein
MSGLPNLEEGQIPHRLVSAMGCAVDRVIAEWRSHKLLLAGPLERIRCPKDTLPVADPICEM